MIEETMYVAVREHKGVEFLDVATFAGNRDKAITRAVAFYRDIPDYTKAHPVIRIAKVTVKEMEEMEEMP